VNEGIRSFLTMWTMFGAACSAVLYLRAALHGRKTATLRVRRDR
jgi:hypothetical protein